MFVVFSVCVVRCAGDDFHVVKTVRGQKQKIHAAAKAKQHDGFQV